MFRRSASDELDDAVRCQAPNILRDARALQRMPEPGYGEVRTCDYVASELRQLGLEVETGRFCSFRAWITRRPGMPNVAFLADLDAVKQRDGSYAHLCGHYMQSSSLLGLARILSAYPSIREDCPNICVIGCPAEEYADLPDRVRLMEQAVVFGIGGKLDLLRRGWLEEMSAVVSVHLADERPPYHVAVPRRSAGVGAWRVSYEEKQHPRRASAAVTRRTAWAFQALLDELRHKEGILDASWEPRLVSPADPSLGYLTVFWSARPDSTGIAETVTRIVGPQARWIECRPVEGYEPLAPHPGLIRLARTVASRERSAAFEVLPFVQGATDLGDVAKRIPSIQLFFGGTRGRTHSSSFSVTDEDSAYVWPVKMSLLLLMEMTCRAWLEDEE